MLEISGTYKFQTILFLDMFLSEINVVRNFLQVMYMQTILILCCHNKEINEQRRDFISLRCPPVQRILSFSFQAYLFLGQYYSLVLFRISFLWLQS